VLSPAAKRLQERNNNKVALAVQLSKQYDAYFGPLGASTSQDCGEESEELPEDESEDDPEEDPEDGPEEDPEDGPEDDPEEDPESQSQKIKATQDGLEFDVQMRGVGKPVQNSQCSSGYGTNGATHQGEHLHNPEAGALQPQALSGAACGRTGPSSHDDSHTQESQRTGETPPANLKKGGQLKMTPKQHKGRNTWTEADQEALITAVMTHKPFKKTLKNAARKSKWQQVVASMQIRKSMQHVLTEHAVRQKYCYIMQWAKESRQADNMASGSREQGQHSPLMKACIELQSLLDQEDGKSQERDAANKKVQGIRSEGAAYQARLANATPPPTLPQKRQGPQSPYNGIPNDIYFPVGPGLNANEGSPDQFVHGSNAVFQAAYAHLARGPPTQSGTMSDSLMEFMRDQAREQREWLYQFQKVNQEAQRASQEAQKDAQKSFQDAMTSMMSMIAGSFHKNG
jgi:hypothetical protein